MENLAVVTGATGGLGSQFVLELARRGYNLILTSTSEEKLRAQKENIEKQFLGIKVWTKVCNLAGDDSRKEFWQFVDQCGLKPGMLINNAGCILEGSFCGCSQDEILTAVKVNALAVLDFAHCFLERRDEVAKSYILNVASLNGLYPMPQMATYASTKSLVMNWSIALRQELKKKNVNVTALCPGSIATSNERIESIKSQGLGGKLSLQPTDKIARCAIDGVLKNKAKVIPGGFNKGMWILTRFVSQKFIAKILHNRWSKCAKKRGDYR